MYARTPEAAEARQHTVMEAVRLRVGPCREWPEGVSARCGRPADYVLWGKLIDRDGLGPRCYDCVVKHVHPAALERDSGWAPVDLWALAEAVDATYPPGRAA